MTRNSPPLKHGKIHQGDCIKLMKKIDEGSIDLVFADPPFNIGYEYDEYDDRQDDEKYLEWCTEWMAEVHRILKPNGTFWLAIGDEYAAELKVAAQRKLGFHTRSWVIWYYTFGVNCVNGFSRSHTHLFHFVKDSKSFTFDRPNPQIRVKSARQLVYADNRANPDGRLPDNTWIIRPQDAPHSFSPSHDTWYFARVAGTFKEREGFHGCQMPEQLLARIIRASSRPQDLVFDPFGGSGTTLCVAKKLGRRWMGTELSKDYAKYINGRLDDTRVGDPIDGPEDPIQSSPSTAKGKRRKKPFDEDTKKAVIEAYRQAGQGFPADYLLCDSVLNEEFISQCLKHGIGGSAFVWNHLLLNLRKQNRLPRANRKPERISAKQMNRYGFASEVAWRLLAIDYEKTLDDILCSPEFAKEFDRIASMFGPDGVTSLEYRRAAFSIRKRTKSARQTAAKNFGEWMKKKLKPIALDDLRQPRFEAPGIFILQHEETSIYAGESENIRQHVEMVLDNQKWQGLDPDSIVVVKNDQGFPAKYAQKSAMLQQDCPSLNCRLWVSKSELPA